MENLKIVTTLVNDKVRFTGVSELHSENPVSFDFTPPVGDGEGFSGLELLLLSFSACVSTAVVALLRRMGKNVASYKANAEGFRNERPLFLKKIVFSIYIESSDLSESDMKNVISQAEKISPVWLAVKNNVEVSVEYIIK
ncbi:MAG: OsmC family protein [Clostridiales bacterium]|nr:OsmC family protein [Clostridiales bacterium]